MVACDDIEAAIKSPFRVVLRDVKRHQNARRWEVTNAASDHFTGSGLQARLPRRAEERAAMIRWLKEMLLLNILLVPPMVFFPAICLMLAAHPNPLAAQLCFWMALFPFAGYFPLVPTWLWRRRHV